MNKKVLSLMLLICSGLYAMEYEFPEISLKEVEDHSMPHELSKSVGTWLKNNEPLITELCTRPQPCNLDGHQAKKEKVNKELNALEGAVYLGDVERNINHTLKPENQDQFVITVNKWQHLLAHCVFTSGQGDVTKESVKSANLDWDKINKSFPTHMHAGRVATYLLLKRAADKKKFSRLQFVPTYLGHIPGRFPSLEDENNVVVQEYIPGFKTVKRMKEEDQRTVVDSWNEETLQELYDATKAGGLWDGCGNLGISSKQPGTMILCDVETTIFHYPQDFLFQNERGHQRYREDVCDGLIRAAGFLMKNKPDLVDKWNEIILRDDQLLNEIKTHVPKPSIVLEYEGNASGDFKKALQEMYGNFPKSTLKIFNIN